MNLQIENRASPFPKSSGPSSMTKRKLSSKGTCSTPMSTTSTSMASKIADFPNPKPTPWCSRQVFCSSRARLQHMGGRMTKRGLGVAGWGWTDGQWRGARWMDSWPSRARRMGAGCPDINTTLGRCLTNARNTKI